MAAKERKTTCINLLVRECDGRHDQRPEHLPRGTSQVDCVCSTSNDYVDSGCLSCVVEVDPQGGVSPLALLETQQGRELMDSHAGSQRPSTKLDFTNFFRSQVFKGELNGDHGGAVDVSVPGEPGVDLHPP